MNLSQLRMLIAIADTGSISRAAERLGITQSGASQALSSLEEHLGVRLVVRQHRGVSLTQVGVGVLKQARNILSSLDSIRQLTDAAQGIEHGRIRLASFPSVFAVLLPPLLRRFGMRHPGIQVVAMEAADDEVRTWLASGMVDIGVVTDPLPERGGVMLYRDEWVAVVPSNHPWGQRDDLSVTLSALVAEPFVLATGGCTMHARSIARQFGLELGDVQVEVSDWASAFTLVREGLGVSLVPALNLPEHRRGFHVLRLETPIYRQLGLEVSPPSIDSPVVKAFLQLASEMLNPERLSASPSGPDV